MAVCDLSFGLKNCPFEPPHVHVFRGTENAKAIWAAWAKYHEV